VCSLCLKDEETNHHLFVNCEVTQLIWKEVCEHFRLNGSWNIGPLNDLVPVISEA
jgi:hypothetical protein